MNRHKSGQSRQKHKKEEMQSIDDASNQDNQHLLSYAKGNKTMSGHHKNSGSNIVATQHTTQSQKSQAAQAQSTRGAFPTNSASSQHTRGKSTHQSQTTSQPPQNQSTSGHHAKSMKQQLTTTTTTQRVTEKTSQQSNKMATVQKTIQQKNMVQISTAQIEATQRKLAQEIQDDSSFDESHVDNRPSSKSSAAVSQYEETEDDDQLNPLEFDCQEDQRSLTAKKGKKGQEGKRLPTTKNSMASSYMISHGDFDDSECNLACSSNSMSPEHAIHTVVVGAMVQQQQATHAGNSAKSCWLNNNNSNERQDSPDKPSKWILTSPQDMSKNNNDFTPATPQSKTNASQGTDQKQQSGRRIDASPADQQQYNEITSYTNGNMAEIVMDDEDEALQREKAEFMYMFEGAMSVIQETDEPDEEMTIKHSAQSSVLQLQRYDSIATPNERMSKEPMPNRPHEFVMISPHKIMFKNVQSMSQANSKRQQKKIQIIKESSNGSIQENSVTSQVESMDEITKPSKLTNQPEPKSISFIDDNTNTTFSKLSDLTKNCIQQQQLSKTLQNTSNHNNNSSAEKHSTSSKHRSPKKSSHSGSQSSSQLKSYLQRQQELLKNNMVPQDCSNSSRGGGPQQHQVYRSPERPPQPKNLSHAPSNNPSTKNTASVLREAEARSNRNNKNATKPDTLDGNAKMKTIENKKQIEKLAKKQEQDTLVAQVTEQLQKVQVAANFAQREQPGTEQNQPNTNVSHPLTATKVQQKSEERAQMKTPVRLQEDSSKNVQLQICSPQTEHNRLVLSPVEKQLSQAEIEMYNLRMQALNTSIVKLREDMKERSVSVFKECKTFNMNNQQSHSLEEKLDYEFLERVMQVYAFFTSCLNLVLLNDKQAHKLLILQPMIEKHITELKIDKLTLQANSTDLFDHPDNTLSSIGGGPSSHNSVASMNGTWLNHLNGGKSLSITPRRDPSIEGLPTPQNANTRSNLLQVAQKLQHLDTLLQIAQQVLQLNSLKHRLIVDNRKSRSISKTNSEQQQVAAPQKTLRGAFSSDQIGMNPNNRELLVNNQQQPSGPLFAGQKNLLQNGKQLKKQQNSCPKYKQSQQLKNSDDMSQQKAQMNSRPESPPRIKLEIQSNSKNVVQQSDPYFTAQKHSQQSKQQQNTKNHRAAKAKRTVESTDKNGNDPVCERLNPKQITDEISSGAPSSEQKIIFHPPQYESKAKVYRRNCSDGQLTGKGKGSCSVTNEKEGNYEVTHQQHEQPQLINRWSDTQDLSNRRKQATDSYFSTNNQSQLALQKQQMSANSAISPKNQKSSQQVPSKQQLQQQQQQQLYKIVGGSGNHSRGGSGSNRMLNLEKAKMSNESFNKTMLQQNSQIQSNSNTHMNAQSTKSTERQTQDQTVIVQGQSSVPSTSKNNFTSGVCQNNSFGVTNYSAGSSGRNLNAANNLQDYQPNQTFSQQTRQKQGSLKQIKDNCESFISVLQHPETHPDLAMGQIQVPNQVQEIEESEFIGRNQEKRWHTREMGCQEVELDCKGNLVLDSGSNHSSQIQKSRNDCNQPANLVVSWRSEESYFSGNSKKNSKKTSSKKQNKPLPNNFSKTILLEKQKRGSLSPHSNNPQSPYQKQKNSTSKNDLALASNYMSSGQKKCSKTIKTNTAFQSETFSEMDMSSLSEATIDQFDVNATGKGVSPNPVKGKKKRSSQKIKGSAKKVAKQIVVFVDNLSDTHNQQSHDSYSRPEIYTKDQIKNKTGRYLTSITSSVIQTPNEFNTDHLSPKNMKTADPPKRQKLTHAASCSVLPESKVKNALKGVIQAQDSYISNNKSVKSIKQTNTSSMNTSANMTASFSHVGVKQSNRNPNHSLRKTSSSKPNSFHIAAMQQQTSNSQHMSVLDQSSSFQYQQQAATTQRRKMHKTHSQQILLSPSNNGTSKRIPTEPMSPTNNSKPLVNPYKKVMPVNSTQKTSNYLLKQKITINPDMIQSPLTTKTQQAHMQQRQQINQQTIHQESSHMKNLQSSSKSSKLQPTCPLSSDRRLRSPSQKSLSQAFNAVAKAISRRQSQTNSAAHTANQSRKHSITGTSSSQQNQ